MMSILLLHVNLKNGGAPTRPDMLQTTLWKDDGTLAFSSNWNGVRHFAQFERFGG